MESDYLPSISFEKFPEGGWYTEIIASALLFAFEFRL